MVDSKRPHTGPVQYSGHTNEGTKFDANANLTGNVFEDMAEFDRKYQFNDVTMTPQFLAFRMMFLVEEFHEAIVAAEHEYWPSFVDAMIDLIVVAAGTLSIGKVRGQEAWNEVRRANMSKVRMANPARFNSGGADLVKPDGWRPPNHDNNTGTFGLISGEEFGRFFPHSMTVLFECLHMQARKYQDYNGKQDVERGHYWIHGINDLEYEMNKKLLRFRSVLDKMRRGGGPPNYEGIVDSLQDDINYHAFAVSLIRNKEPGYDPRQMDLFGGAVQ